MLTSVNPVLSVGGIVLRYPRAPLFVCDAEVLTERLFKRLLSEAEQTDLFKSVCIFQPGEERRRRERRQTTAVPDARMSPRATPLWLPLKCQTTLSCTVPERFGMEKLASGDAIWLRPL